VTVWRDDLGSPVDLAAPVRRVVSLVPSLTEAVARSAAGLLVGATDWCAHPPGLAVTRPGRPSSAAERWSQPVAGPRSIC